MYVAQLRLAGGAARLSPHQMAGLFWAGRTPDDEVEHVHVQLDRGSMWLTVFLLAASQADADRAAREFCVRILLAAPELAGWSLLL